MGLWFSGRTIVESPDVSKYLDESKQKYPRIEDAWVGATWILARKCENLGHLTMNHDGQNYYLVKFGADKVAGTPHIVIAYTFTDNEVHVIGLRFEE